MRGWSSEHVHLLLKTGGGYDRNHASVERCVAAAETIHHNPVRRGLVEVANGVPLVPRNDRLRNMIKQDSQPIC